MQVHEGWLYASTMSWASLLPYLPTYAWPPDIAAVLRRWSPDRLAETGGFSLWRTDDCVHWEPVTRDGFGTKFNWGGDRKSVVVGQRGSVRVDHVGRRIIKK